MKKIAFIVALALGITMLGACKPAKANIDVEQKTFSQEFNMRNEVSMAISYSVPFISGKYAGVDKINDYYRNKVTEYLKYKEPGQLDSAKPPFVSKYIVSATLTVQAILKDIISIKGDDYIYIGGAHGMPQVYGEVFNLKTGNKLALGDLFSIDHPDYKSILYDRVTQMIIDENADATIKNKRFLFVGQDRESIRSAAEEEYHNDFYLTNTAVVMIYQVYTLGPFSSGTFEFTIPFALLKDELNKNIY